MELPMACRCKDGKAWYRDRLETYKTIYNWPDFEEDFSVIDSLLFDIQERGFNLTGTYHDMWSVANFSDGENKISIQYDAFVDALLDVYFFLEGGRVSI